MISLAAYVLLFVIVGVGFIFVHLMVGKLIRPSKPVAEKGTIYECGEPTIGSAWVQFDLRYYVIALLFVIFDVEVAFFFPWAEVFGKANTIATAPPPSTPAASREYARTLLDLMPIPSTGRQKRERALYTLLQTLTPEQVAAFQGLTPEGRKTLLTVAEERRAELTANPAQPPKPLTEEELDQVAGLPPEARSALAALPPEQLALLPDLRAEGLEALASTTPLQFEEHDRFAENRKDARTLSWIAFGEIVVFFGVLLVGFAYLWRRGDLAWVRSTAAEAAPAVPAPRPAPATGAPAAPVLTGAGHP
jgi:NADH:ubiquinone oxidoreductase subunit 3 (subunit A)